MAKRGARKRNVKNRRPEKARVVPPDGVPSGCGSDSLGMAASGGGASGGGASDGAGESRGSRGSGDSESSVASAVPAQGGPVTAVDLLSGGPTEYRWILGSSASTPRRFAAQVMSFDGESGPSERSTGVSALRLVPGMMVFAT